MQMASLIEESLRPQLPDIHIFTERLKSIVHEELRNRTIIFTTTDQNTKFHYYTILDHEKSSIIQLYWLIEFFPNRVQINATYSTYRTLRKPIILNDLRTRIEVNFLLKILNKNCPYFLTFLLNDRHEVCLNFSRSICHETDKIFLIKSLKSIVNQIYTQCIHQFSCLIPYLSIPIQIIFKNQSHEKRVFQSQQFNLIKLKNTFDRFRKNRQKTADLIYEEKDVLKARKQIQGISYLLGIQMRSLNNMMYTTKEIQRQKLLNTIDKNEDNQTPAKVDKIAYQFQIIKIQETEKKFDVNANSQIYMGKYIFRIFKTLVQEEKLTKSCDSKKTIIPQFEEKDVIESRISVLIKKKANSKLSQKALKNEVTFLKFMRNRICIYLANYFIPLESTTQLYVQRYEQSLLNLIQKDKIPILTKIDIMEKLIRGLKFISDSNICHRDIKPSNIMISKDNNPKIIDFGSTISTFGQRVLLSCNEKLCATEGYHVPYEELDQKIKRMFTKKQYEAHPLFDVYSFAVILEKLLEHDLNSINNDSVKDTFVFIIQKGKQHNPDNRLSYDQILCLLLTLKKSLLFPSHKVEIL